jgi:hypothetical protein
MNMWKDLETGLCNKVAIVIRLDFFYEKYGKILKQTYAMSCQLLPTNLLGRVDVSFNQ